MTENSDDRLIVPASTIIILFLTLLVVIPVATLRMSRSLASPIAEVITLVEGGGHFRGRWKIDEVEYLVGQEHDEAGSIDTVAVSVRKTGQTEPLTSSTRERNGVIETVLFLDPDGDRYSAVIIAIRSVDSSGSLQVLMYNFSQAGDPTVVSGLICPRFRSIYRSVTSATTPSNDRAKCWCAPSPSTNKRTVALNQPARLAR